MGAEPMTLRTFLVLGRVSNLPTVWSDVAAGLALVGAGSSPRLLLVIGLAASLMYAGGMYLNDAFDHAHDAEHRKDRPIPSGRISAQAVYVLGFALLAGGLLVLSLLPRREVLAYGGALAVAIVVYDVAHRKNPLAPVVMGVCRMLVYAVAAAAVVSPDSTVWIAGAGLLAYIVGLTHAARLEHLGKVETVWPLVLLAVPVGAGLWRIVGAPPPGQFALIMTVGATFALALWIGSCLRWLLVSKQRNVPRAVGGLIAGVALVDAIVIAGAGYGQVAVAAVLAFLCTLILQRVVPGT